MEYNNIGPLLCFVFEILYVCNTHTICVLSVTISFISKQKKTTSLLCHIWIKEEGGSSSNMVVYLVRPECFFGFVHLLLRILFWLLLKLSSMIKMFRFYNNITYVTNWWCLYSVDSGFFVSEWKFWPKCLMMEHMSNKHTHGSCASHTFIFIFDPHYIFDEWRMWMMRMFNILAF